MAKLPSTVTKTIPAPKLVESPSVDIEVEDDSPAPKAEAAPTEAPAPKRASRYRVKREVAVQINGCLTHLVAGQVVDAQHYSYDTIDRLMSQGIELEEIA